jgi:hypothetical protein
MIRHALAPLLVLVLVALAALAVATPAAGTGHYLPRAGDSFSYSEEVVLSDGTGNYTGYSEHDFINGSIAVKAVASNGSATTGYASTGYWFNNEGQSTPSSESGTFGFSDATYLYVNGTDNQTGYVNPYVWFYVNNTLPVGGSLYLLNTPMQVDATSASYPMASSPTGYVATIRAEGNGSYQRNDVYGVFTATYTWVAYFDPSTGYIVGYLYTEHDSDPSGDGFTWTDSLSDTHTTFPLTAASAPATSSPGSTNSDLALVLVLVVVVVVVIVVVILLARARSRRSGATGMGGPALARHAGPGAPSFQQTFPAPPPVSLTPGGQPAVQQIVIKETVKVPCQFCGTLIDSTARVCPNCGAPRT